eukprot:113394_1
MMIAIRMSRVSLFYPRSFAQLSLMVSTAFRPNPRYVCLWIELCLIYGCISSLHMKMNKFYYHDVDTLFYVAYRSLHWVVCIVLALFTIDVLIQWRGKFIFLFCTQMLKKYPHHYVTSYSAMYMAYSMWRYWGESDECAVCYKTLDDNIKSILFHCGHRFCLLCTKKMRQYSKSPVKYHFPCALCKKPIGSYHMYDFNSIDLNRFRTGYIDAYNPYDNPLKIRVLTPIRITRYIARYAVYILYGVMVHESKRIRANFLKAF